MLMRLRLNLLEWDLAFWFNVSEVTISRMLNRWINFCYLRLRSLPIWPTWEKVEESMPDCFQQAYPTTLCIIEIFCKAPSSLPLQVQFYSNYKSHCTYKSLVAVAPNGAIIFISELSIVDWQLTIQSGFLEVLALVLKRKSVMADRGFEIRDFSLKLSQHTTFQRWGSFEAKWCDENSENCKSANPCGKSNRSSQEAISHSSTNYSIVSCNEIWTVCCLLNNIRGPLIATSSWTSNLCQPMH